MRTKVNSRALSLSRSEDSISLIVILSNLLIVCCLTRRKISDRAS